MSVWSTLGEVLLGLGLAVEPGTVGAPETGGVPEVVSPAADAVTLTWDAPAGCPSAVAVRQAMAGYLGEGPSADAGASVHAMAQVSEAGGSYRLSLRTETASGVTTRETSATDCAVLVDATAVIVAIAVDPATVLGRGDAAPRPETPPQVEPQAPTPVSAAEQPEPTPALEPAPPLEPVPLEPSTEPRLRFGMRVGGGIDVGVLPHAAGGLRLTGALLGRRWRAELHGDDWLPRTTIVEPGIGARVGLWSLGARGCGVPGVARARLEFPLCGGLEAGAMRGDPVGERVSSPSTSRKPWMAIDLSAGLAWAPRRFLAVVVQAELVVPVLRAGFRVGEVEVHRARAVAGRGLVGLEARFP